MSGDLEAADAAVVERAKGALMLLYGVEAPAAQTLLEEWEAESGYSQVLLSEALLHAVSRSPDRPEPDGVVLWLTQELRCERSVAPGLPGA